MNLLVYGAYGYTGRLIARQAVSEGLAPVLAGRDPEQLAAFAGELGLPSRTFGLDDPAALRAGLGDARVVIHCAGPFSLTSRPMIDACLARRAHYLDITGEIDVLEGAARRDREAREAGILVLPGAGFDVVPTDCLAGHLARRLPGARRLALAFRPGGGMSRGTARTTAGRLGSGGAVRRGGRIVRVPVAHERRLVDFGDGPEPTMAIPWGDVATAWHTTGIPDITVFVAAPALAATVLRVAGPLLRLLRGPRGQAFVVKRLTGGRSGPSDARRERGHSRVWGEAVDEAGTRVVSRMKTPEGYTLTARTAVALAREALDGRAPAGFQTPARGFGPDFVLGIEGVSREDVV